MSEKTDVYFAAYIVLRQCAREYWSNDDALLPAGQFDAQLYLRETIHQIGKQDTQSAIVSGRASSWHTRLHAHMFCARNRSSSFKNWPKRTTHRKP